MIRVLGVDAGFTRESYVPGEEAGAARRDRRIDVLAAGVPRRPRGCADLQRHADERRAGDGSRARGWTSLDRPATFSVPVGAWPSGVYFAKLTADDGRIGFAPFVVRPAQLGSTRVAVIIPTNTWQAYNFRDQDGNGWGDTWYAKGAQSTCVSVAPSSAEASRRSTGSTTSAFCAGSHSTASNRTT